MPFYHPTYIITSQANILYINAIHNHQDYEWSIVVLYRRHNYSGVYYSAAFHRLSARSDTQASPCPAKDTFT